MKTDTIMTMIGIIAVVGIASTLSIGMISQQAYSKACNLTFDNDTGTYLKQTGSACDSESDYGTLNIHFK